MNAPIDPARYEQASPSLQDDGAEVLEAELDEGEWEPYFSSAAISRLMVNFGSLGISMFVHLVGLLLLAYLTVSNPVHEMKTLVEAVFEAPLEDEFVEVELDPDLHTVAERSTIVESARPLVGVEIGAEGLTGPPQLDEKVFHESSQSTAVDAIDIDFPLAGAPTFKQMVEAVPDGEFKGDPRAVIDDYQQAMDRIAQELMWMMDRGPVLVIWVFDQSGSMKDDQQEIRDRIEVVYRQLGLLGRDEARWLTTSIVSFGEGYQLHTPRPTADLEAIRAAINSVPEDESGKEYMCRTVMRAVAQHREYAKSTRRQMAMVLVTDESGEQEDNLQNLEPAIAMAKEARCRIYVLGREAVFGYPYAHIRWEHPQTNRIHWLQINRGPETGFPEQLQIDGFQRRRDAFPAGFGPYEQCRLTRETGGVFFMLPSLESALVRGEKRRYELEAMRPYRPDLVAREELFAQRASSPLRSIIWQCISDLNPYNPSLSQQIEMRVHFSPEYAEFVRQANVETGKARNYLQYMARVQQALEQGSELRHTEADPRWQANYDLIYAQLIAYQARIWEYGASLKAFVDDPPTVAPTKPPNRQLVHFNASVRRKTLTEESKPYIERATELFHAVIQDHPGTPWAQRAASELERGFGVEFRPEYRRPYAKPSGGVTVPIPKL